MAIRRKGTGFSTTSSKSDGLLFKKKKKVRSHRKSNININDLSHVASNFTVAPGRLDQSKLRKSGHWKYKPNACKVANTMPGTKQQLPKRQLSSFPCSSSQQKKDKANNSTLLLFLWVPLLASCVYFTFFYLFMSTALKKITGLKS